MKNEEGSPRGAFFISAAGEEGARRLRASRWDSKGSRILARPARIAYLLPAPGGQRAKRIPQWC